jgi:repressor LexA
MEERMMSIGKNIKRLRKIHNLSQKELAEIAGVSNKAVSTWENDIKEPRMGVIQKIADHFGISKSDIIESQDIINLQKSKGNCSKVPYLGSIAAGIPLEMVVIKEEITIPDEIFHKHPHAFFVKVEGDSMNKIIPPNVLALIDPTLEVKNGDIAAVAVNGYDATLKRFYRFQDGITLEPESFNPKHKTQFYDAKSQEYNPIHVKGKLVWYMPPFDLKL